ncbi:MAG: hypothetical protein LIP01_15875 [Tannerellaceae bacterium]|nr:hypothetical protein [Tannerellaceae bacterium]
MVWIYNYDTGEKELLDPDAYEFFSRGIYSYKNRLYFNSAPVSHKLKTENIHWLADTYFLTDGEKLLAINTNDYFTKSDFSGISFYRPAAAINEVDYGIDFETLQIINPWTLIDKNYLYYTKQIVPIYKLGLDVKVIPL